MWYEVEEGVAQQSTGGEAEQDLEQVLVLVAVGLNRDQKQDEERSRTDQQRRSDSLQTGKGRGLQFNWKNYSTGEEQGCVWRKACSWEASGGAQT